MKPWFGKKSTDSGKNSKKAMLELSFEPITKKNIKQIRYEDVQVFSFAEVGAMGDGGSVEIVVQDDKGVRAYKTNYVFGVFETIHGMEEWEKEQEIIFDLLPILREIDFNNNIIRTYGNLGEWMLFDMGFGNHLLVRPKFAVDLMREFGGKPVEKLYSGWKDFFKAALC